MIGRLIFKFILIIYVNISISSFIFTTDYFPKIALFYREKRNLQLILRFKQNTIKSIRYVIISAVSTVTELDKDGDGNAESSIKKTIDKRGNPVIEENIDNNSDGVIDEKVLSYSQKAQHFWRRVDDESVVEHFKDSDGDGKFDKASVEYNISEVRTYEAATIKGNGTVEYNSDGSKTVTYNMEKYNNGGEFLEKEILKYDADENVVETINEITNLRNSNKIISSTKNISDDVKEIVKDVENSEGNHTVYKTISTKIDDTYTIREHYKDDVLYRATKSKVMFDDDNGNIHNIGSWLTDPNDHNSHEGRTFYTVYKDGLLDFEKIFYVPKNETLDNYDTVDSIPLTNYNVYDATNYGYIKYDGYSTPQQHSQTTTLLYNEDKEIILSQYYDLFADDKPERGYVDNILDTKADLLVLNHSYTINNEDYLEGLSAINIAGDAKVITISDESLNTIFKEEDHNSLYINNKIGKKVVLDISDDFIVKDDTDVDSKYLNYEDGAGHHIYVDAEITVI
ncbi:hypothetical protein [Phocoenobacter atlanticus]|uniref:hypothetical protein n=2 Tax=Pasteurellales TaxID=135625 RepID=UPI00274CC04C|nr:hypothetical protein [Pasteurella atlantica]MDP8102072.1 hypothetical protein [Pasteurella atlantica]